MSQSATDILERTSSYERSWPARLKLRTGLRRGRTRVLEKQQLGPLSLQKAHYPEQDLAHLHVLHPPGGVVGGDTLHMEVSTEQSGRALITTPGATKFYAGNGFPARQFQKLQVGQGTSLEWLPQENILFDLADVELNTEIHIEPDAALVAWEVNTFGRPASGQYFSSGSFKNRLRLYRGESLIYQDRFIHDDSRDSLNTPLGLRGMQAMATMLVMPVEQPVAEQVQKLFHHRGRALGVTWLDNFLVFRGIAESSTLLRNWMTEVWFHLRPSIIGRDGITPRIWNT